LNLPSALVARMSQIAFFTRDGDMRGPVIPDIAPTSCA
jgi:hypothetical protein